MADLGIFDIVALSKAGYKKKDIDAIIAGEKAKPSEPQSAADPVSDPEPSNDPEPQPQGADAEPQPQGADAEPHTEGKAEEVPDYKKLYEAIQKEQEATKQQIKNLQAQINSQDRSGGSTAPYDPQSDLLASLSKFS